MFFITLSLQNITFLHSLQYFGIKESNSDYVNPTQVSRFTAEKGQFLAGFYISSIWIVNEINATIWKDNLNKTIQRHVDLNTTSIKCISLWANSSTLGINILYFTFEPYTDVLYLGTPDYIGLVLLLIFIPVAIIIGIVYGKYKKTKVPSFVIKKWFKEIVIKNNELEFTFYYRVFNKSIRKFLSKIIIWIDNILYFDINLFPDDYDVELNGTLYSNRDLNKIIDNNIQKGDLIRLTTPNRTNLSTGMHQISMGKKRHLF